MDISGTELMKSVEQLSDEELKFAESGLNKLLAIVLQEKQKRNPKKRKFFLTNRKSRDTM